MKTGGNRRQLCKSLSYYQEEIVVGCQHGCHYCYARFIRRFSGYTEPWGKFVDVKINAADFFQRICRELAYACRKSGITCNLTF